jgi:hypothetical protein
MAVGTTLMGGMFSGFLSNHIDIAPRFAGNKLSGIQGLQLVHNFNRLAYTDIELISACRLHLS